MAATSAGVWTGLVHCDSILSRLVSIGSAKGLRRAEAGYLRARCHSSAAAHAWGRRAVVGALSGGPQCCTAGRPRRRLSRSGQWSSAWPALEAPAPPRCDTLMRLRLASSSPYRTLHSAVRISPPECLLDAEPVSGLGAVHGSTVCTLRSRTETHVRVQLRGNLIDQSVSFTTGCLSSKCSPELAPLSPRTPKDLTMAA